LSEETGDSPTSDETELNQLGLVGLGLIHEMGNPITATLLGLELLREQVETGSLNDPEAIAQQLNRQITRVRHMAAVVSRFRQWMHKEDPFIEVIDPEKVANTIVRMLRASLDATGKTVPVVVAPPIPVGMIKADQIFLERSLTCVLMNASEAAALGKAPRGDVRISFWNDDSFVGVVVDDNGPGFESLETATLLGESTKKDGMGVGLALVRQMLEAMGGKLHLSNRATDGACVTLMLPRAGKS